MATSDPRITIRADNKTKAAFGSVDKSLKGLKKTAIAASVAIAAAATAVIAIVKATTESTRSTIAFSNALGVSVENLSRWEFAAESVGLAGDKVGDIMKDAADKIGDAFRNNAGEAKEAIESLGLDLQALANLSPDQQLLRIADALEDVKTTAEKVFILESIGNDLSLMLPLLEDNAKGLKEMADRADELGVTLTAFEAAEIKKADRAFKDLEAAMDSFGQTVTTVVAGPLTDLLENLNRLLPRAAGHFTDALLIARASFMSLMDIADLEGPQNISKLFDKNIAQLREIALLAAAGKEALIIPIETQDDPEQLAAEAREKRRQEELNALMQFEFDRTRIEMDWTQRRMNFEFMMAQEKTKFVLSEAVKITRGVAFQSRALFEINKIAGAANATINAFEAFTTTQKAYPEPLGSIMGGIALLAGLAQAAAISSASFGGGAGGGGAGAGGIGTPALSPPSDAATVPNIGEFTGATEINVTIEGTGLITRDQAEMIAESIAKFIRDGGEPLPT